MEEWTMLLPFMRMEGGYPKGFDPQAVYEWKRVGSDEVHTYRLADQHELFNVWGLMYRTPPSTPNDLAHRPVDVSRRVVRGVCGGYGVESVMGDNEAIRAMLSHFSPDRPFFAPPVIYQALASDTAFADMMDRVRKVEPLP